MLDSQRVQIDNKFITYDVDVLPCVDMFRSLAFKITNLCESKNEALSLLSRNISSVYVRWAWFSEAFE